MEEQKRSRFHYQYSNYQVEYSRNLIFEIGGQMDQVFQALIDRSRVLLDLKTVRTILGYQRRPRYHKRKKKSAEWEVAVERPTYDLTIFKLHCGKLTLKIYTKGERVLRIEVVVHNTQELRCGRSLEKFPKIVAEAKSIHHFVAFLEVTHLEHSVPKPCPHSLNIGGWNHEVLFCARLLKELMKEWRVTHAFIAD